MTAIAYRNDPLILALDCGTQSTRAIVFDLHGETIAKSKITFESYHSIKPLWCEQDPDYFWKQLCKTCQEIWSQKPDIKKRLHAVVVTTQRGTIVNVDKAGKPLRPAIIWLDKRTTENLPPLKGLWGQIFRILGVSEAIANFQANAEANWIAENQPEIWAATYKYLLLSGYLNFRLCGRFVDSASNQVGYLPFDFKRHKWAKPRDWKWKLQPLTLEKLPELVPCSSTLGTITPQASEETGIPKDLPLIAAAGDKACEVLGSGCLHPYQGSISYGTSSTFNVTGKKYLELYHYLPPYPAAYPGGYTNEYQINRGYWLVNWFKENFGYAEQIRAKELNVPIENLFDELIKDIPPGNMGLILQPFWSHGPSIKKGNAKGAIIGFSDVHTKAHIYQSIIEGIAYALRQGKEILEHLTGIPVTTIRVSGGGSQSDLVMQMTADIFGKSVSRLHTYETAGLGAAIDVAVGQKLYPDFETAVNAMVRTGDLFEPRPKEQELYHNLYERVYKKIYPQLQPLYDEIHKIIG